MGETKYNILIVDDERVVRECIRFLIEKSALPFEVKDTDDPIATLDMIRAWPVDVLIADIQMPGMNGLDMVKRAKEMVPELRVVFFSGYTDFEYARTAVMLGAVNYLVKPVDPEELDCVLEKVLKELDHSRAHQQSQTHQHRMVVQYAMQRAIRGDERQLNACFGNGETWRRHYSSMLLLYVEDVSEAGVLEAGTELLKENLGLSMDILELDEHQRLLFLHRKIRSRMELASRAIAVLQPHIRGRFYIALSNDLDEYKSLGMAYDAVQKSMNQRFWALESKAFLDAGSEAEDTINQGIDNSELLKHIQEDLEAGDAARFAMDMEELFKAFRRPAIQSQLYVKFIFSSLISCVYPHLCTARAACNQNIPSLDRLISEMFIQPSIEAVIDSMMSMTEEVYENLRSSQNTDLRKEVQIVQQHVLRNYASELSIEKLAELVYLAPDYLSRLFKQATGKSLGGYIKQVRMENASRMLLETNQKVREISKAVGYSNYSYFCQRFREYYGKSPDKYRREGGVDENG